MRALLIPPEEWFTHLILADTELWSAPHTDTFVGGPMLRGISGGQKKRLTTGEMLVSELLHSLKLH